MSRVGLILLVAVALGTRWAGTAFGQDDPIAARLTKAKETFTAESDKIRGGILESLDKRIEAAGNADNEALKSQLAAERRAFAQHGDQPPGMAPAQLKKQQLLTASLIAGFESAIRDYKKAGRAADEQRIEQELKAFHDRLTIMTTRKLLLGRWHLVLGGYETDYVFHANGTCEQVAERLKLEWFIDLPLKRIVVHRPGKKGMPSEIIDLPLDPQRTIGRNFRGDQFSLSKKPAAN